MFGPDVSVLADKTDIEIPIVPQKFGLRFLLFALRPPGKLEIVHRWYGLPSALV